MSKAVVVPECIQNVLASKRSTWAGCLLALSGTVAFFIFLVSSSSSVYAQAADEAGVKPFATLQGGAVEDINLSNHTLNLHPTLLSYPQRGGKLEFKFNVQYTNATWQEKETCLPGIPKTCTWLWFPDAGGTAKINVVLSRGIPFFFTQALNSTTNPPLAYFVKLSDGSTHPVGQIGTSLYESLDSTGILLNTSTFDIFSPDGVRANASSSIITDPNGNQITQTSSGWVDTMGRNIPEPPSTNGNIASGGVTTTDFSHCTGQLPIDSAALWAVPGPNGGTSTYKFCFVKVHVFTKHWTTDDSTHSEMNNDEVEIQSIVLPDNSAWTFDYSQPDANGVNWGDLVKITYPTGGSVSYVWVTSHGCSVAQTFNDASYRAVTQRIIDANDGSGPQKWQYSGSTVTDPLQNDTVHTYTNLSGCSFYETQTQTYNGSQSAGNLIQTVTTEYSWDLNPNTAGGTGGNPAPTPTAINVFAKSRTTTLANGLVKKTSYTPDAGFPYTDAGGFSHTGLYGKVVSQVDTDWGQGTAGQPLRETDTQYQFLTDSTGAYRNADLLETPNSVIVKDGAGTVVAKTTFGYDESFNNINTQPSGITTQHVSLTGPRGNRTSTTRWVLLGNTPITSHTIPYDSGEPYQAFDANGNTTTYSYDSAYVGAFQTMTCRPNTGTTHHCVSGTYDFNTGQLTSLTNENGAFQASGNTQGDPAHTIVYGYNDSLGRLTSTTYPADSAGSHPETDLFYSAGGVTPATVEQTKTIAGTKKDDATTYFDGLGRQYKAVHTSAGGATVITTYDLVGRTASVTNPYTSLTDATYGVTRYEYDPLGRPTKTTKQDGSFSSIDYSQGNCAVGTDEAGTQLRRCTDGLGRISEVDEPGDSFAGINASGSLSISGTLKSTTVGGSPAQQATGSITIAGTEKSVTSPGERFCADFVGNPPRCVDWETTPPTTVNDSGTVNISINGQPFSYSYGANDSVTTIANSFAASIRANSASVDYTSIVVNTSVTPPTATISLIARSAGSGGNSITLATSATTYDTTDFTSASFSPSVSGPDLTGGANAVPGTPVYDSGQVSLTVGGLTATANYGNGLDSTAAAVAADLVNQIKGQLPATNPPFSLSVPTNGTTITINFNVPATESAISISTGTQTSYFSTPSFAACSISSNPQNCTISLGGADAYASGIAHPYVTMYSHDALGNLTCVEQHGNTTGTGCSAPASSDVTSAWRVRRFAYDSLSRLISSSNPETNTYVSSTGAVTRGNTVYSYDNNGNLIQKVSPGPNQTGNGIQVLSYCYDALNRLTGKAYSAETCQNGQLPTGTAAVSYAYDQGSNGIGQRTGMSDASGSSNWGYDALGRMTTWQRTTGTVSKTIGYSYNLDSSLATMTYPSGAVVTYAPDAAGRPLSAVDTANNIQYITNTIYNAASLPASFTSGASATFGGIANTFSYNQRLQPLTILAASPTQTLLNLTYDFHEGNGNNGNVWAVTNGKDASRSETFAYDQMNRLTSAQTAGTDCTKMTANGKTEYWGNSYGYDPWGNLMQKSVTKCSAENLGVNASVSNQLSGYNYDAAGSMISDPSDAVSVTYDPENRIASVSQGGLTTTYTYDGDGNRVKKATGGTGMLYWYGLPGALAESDLTGMIKSEYVFFNGTRVARRDEVTPAGVYYYFSDHIKSASLVTDAAGNVKSESDYYPWGGELSMSNSDPNHYKFTGKEHDTESGLDYFGARFYSASMGRFMTPDWSEKPATVPYADLSDPQTLNIYSYVRNSPVARFDADGHFVTSAGSAAAPACNDGTDSCHQPPPDVDDQIYKDGNTIVAEHTETRQYYLPGEKDANGNETPGALVKTTTTTIATFSTEKGHEGQFLGATTETTTSTMKGNAETTTTTGPVKTDYFHATQAISSQNMLKAALAANPSVLSSTVKGMAQTSIHHPVGVFGGSAGIIGGVLSIPANPAAGIATTAAGVTTLWCTAGGSGC